MRGITHEKMRILTTKKSMLRGCNNLFEVGLGRMPDWQEHQEGQQAYHVVCVDMTVNHDVQQVQSAQGVDSEPCSKHPSVC